MWYNAGSGLYRRYRRWTNVNPALVQCLVLGVSITGMTMYWTDVGPLSASLANIELTLRQCIVCTWRIVITLLSMLIGI